MAIYKFIGSDRVVDALFHQKLRISQPATFNDPYESRYFSQPLGGSDLLREQIQQLTREQVADRLVILIKGFPPIVQQTSDFDMDHLEQAIRMVRRKDEDPYLYGRGMINMIAVKLNYILSVQVGVLCFSGNRVNLLQWAHYADEHQGIVLEFDEDHPFFKNPGDIDPGLSRLKRVNYGYPRTPLDLDFEDVTAPLYRKGKDWNHEDEWRMLLSLSEGEDLGIKDSKGCAVVLKNYPLSALTGVVIGHQMRAPKSAAIASFIRNTPGLSGRVRIEYCLLNDREYKIDFGPFIEDCPNSGFDLEEAKRQFQKNDTKGDVRPSFYFGL